MPKDKVRQAVKVRKAQPDYRGRKVKKEKRLDINAPVSDFVPVAPGQSFRHQKAK